MLGKLIITGKDRRTALARARRALDEIRIEGVPTVLPLDRNILAHHDFAETFAVHTGWIEEHLEELVDFADDDEGADSTFVEVPVGRDRHRIHLPGLAVLGDRAAEIKSRAVRSGAGIDQGDVAVIPMQGTVVKVAVSEGDRVEKGDLIAAVEAMKMENAVLAHRAGVIVGLAVAVGDVCCQGEQICRIEADSAE
jgi:acetyl-CoA/propionyl-CoA carboxylase biotin carboxyl carrier protein